MPNLRQNIIYKALLSTSNYLLALVTFPYITRILGPEDFGLVNFALNTVDYFLLFATLGIINIGTREVAIAKRNINELSKVYSNILGLNLICTLLSLGVLIVCIFLIPRFAEIKSLLLIGCSKIICAAFAVEWFFSGLEKFKYITLRSLMIKIIYVLSVFLLVKNRTDANLYFILTIASVVLNSVVNFAYSFRYINFNIRELLSLKYLKPNVKLGIYTVMTSMYVTFNVMYLGLMTSDLEVGYYSAGVKLYFVVVTLFSSYTSVMMPRLSALLNQKDLSTFQLYLSFSYQLVFRTAIPIMTIGIVFAPQLIRLLSGPGYEQAIVPMRIVLLALLPVWLSSVIAFQGLIPMKKDDILMKASFLGGGLGLMMNMLIVSKYGANGSALVLLGSELTVFIYYLAITLKDSLFNLPLIREIFKCIESSVPYLIVSMISLIFFSEYVALGITSIVSIVYFFIINKEMILTAVGKRKFRSV